MTDMVVIDSVIMKVNAVNRIALLTDIVVTLAIMRDRIVKTTFVAKIFVTVKISDCY